MQDPLSFLNVRPKTPDDPLGFLDLKPASLQQGDSTDSILNQLLLEPTVDEASRQRIRQFLSKKEGRDQGFVEEMVRSFGSGLVAPLTGISQTVDAILPGEGSSRITQGLQSAQQAIGPSDEVDPNQAARVIGGLAGYLVPSAGIYKVLGKVVAGLGGVASRAAPTIAARATARIAATADKIGKVSPALGAATLAAPAELATAALQTGLQSPGDFTSPASLGLLAGGTAFGLVTGGISRARSAARALDGTPVSPSQPNGASKFDPIEPRPDNSTPMAYAKSRLRRPKSQEPLPTAPQIWSELKRRLVNAGDPLKRIDETLEKQYQLASGSSSSLHQFMKGEPFQLLPDGTPQPLGIWNAEKIFKALGEDGIDDLGATLWARRISQDLDYRARQTPEDILNADLVWQNTTPLQKEMAERWTQLDRAVRDFMEAGGLLKGGVGKAWDALNENYTLLRKALGEKPLAENRPTGKNFSGPRELFQRLKGGAAPVWNPVLASIDRWEKGIRAVYTNRVGLRLAELVEQDPARLARMGITQVVDPTPQSLPRLKTPVDDYKKVFETEGGVKLTDEEALEGLLTFSPEAKKELGNTVAVRVNGRLQRYEVPKEVAEAFHALNPRDLQWYEQILGFPAKTLRAGIVYNPVFQAFNFIRDSFDAQLQSQYGFKLGLDSFRGWINAVRQTGIYNEWKAGGGGVGISSIIKRGGMLEQDFRSVVPSSNPVQGAWRIYKRHVEAMEEAARLGEYMRGRKQGATVMEAVLASKNVTVNFQRMGLNMQGLSYMTAFLNPGIQGLARTGTTIQNAFAKGPAGVASLLTKGVVGITMPSLLFWMANKDDEEIQELRKTEGGMRYWFIRGPADEIFRIPKPFLWGQMFGSGMETILDVWKGNDPKAVDDLAKAIFSELAVGGAPTALTAAASLLANKDLSFNLLSPASAAPIVPEAALGLDPSLQKSASTTKVAQWMTQIPVVKQALGLVGLDSPARFQFLVQQFTGTLGGDLLKAMDLSTRGIDPFAPATPMVADLPIIGRLVARYPSSSTKSIKRFYEEAERLAPIVATMKKMEDSGNPAALVSYVNTHAEDIGLAQIYAETRKEISELRGAIEEIQQLPVEVMEPSRKRELVDHLTKAMIEIAGQVNLAVEGAREQPVLGISPR